jgi:DNA-binding NtrC family response regulator
MTGAELPRGPEAFSRIVTRDPTMRALFSYVEAVARSPQPLLVVGESPAPRSGWRWRGRGMTVVMDPIVRR